MGTVKRSWKLQEFVAHRANVNCLAMGHKSNQVLATGGDDKKVNLWAIGRHSCLMSLSGHTTPVECVCFGHSEDLVCAGSQTGALKIWDLEAAKLLRTFTGHKGAIKCMDFHPYGDYLTSGSCDNNIKLWDTRKRGCIVTYASHRRAVNSLQFSPDGQWIASACEDGIVKVWDVRVGKVLKEFDDHTAAVTCIKFHPHEFLLASCSVDRTVNFWDMEKFQLVSKHQKESSPVRHLLFSNDGMSLLGGGHDGLQVIGWEPTRIMDTVSSTWGQIHDMTVAHNQLIAGSFHSTYVVMSVVDLNKVHPFGGPPPVATPVARDTSPFQKGQTVRKSFSKERPAKEVLHNKTVLDDKTVEESTSGTEADEESAAVIPNFSDYQEIFRPSRALNRTPPPSTSYLSGSDTEDVKDLPPSSQCTRSLRDLSLADVDNQPTSAPSSLPSDPSTSKPTQTLLQKQKTELFYSRIPTSTKENHNNVSMAEKSKSDIFVRSMDSISTADDSTYVTPHMSGRRQSPSRSHMPQQILNRQHSYKENSRNNNNINNYYNSRKLRPSHSEVSLGPPSLGGRSLSFSNALNEPARAPKTSPAPERRPARTASPGFEAYDMAPTGIKTPRERVTDTDYVPIATDKPVGLDLDDFLPKANLAGGRLGGMVPEQSEQEVFGIMMRGHDSMMAVLSGRQRSLQIFHSVRTNKNLRSALESTIALDDVAVIVDILNVMAHKPSLWNLDICLLLLPKIHELLQSKYESYMTCGCNSLRLILRNFSSVIKSNVNSPVRSLGVDIPREERYSKCLQIHDVLLDIRAFLLKRQTMQGRLGATFRDLHNLIQQGLE